MPRWRRNEPLCTAKTLQNSTLNDLDVISKGNAKRVFNNRRAPLSMEADWHDDTVFTPKQTMLLDALIAHDSIKSASRSIGMSYPAAKQIMYRLRKRYREAQAFQKNGGLYSTRSFRLVLPVGIADF